MLLQTLFTFLLTVVAGGAIADRWQRRRSSEARLYDASNETYKQMLQASDRLVTLIGDRIYCSQRIALLRADNPAWPEAVIDYSRSVIEWNKSLGGIELQIKNLFRSVYSI